MREVLASKRTVVFYESCHRIIKCLEQIAKLDEKKIEELKQSDLVTKLMEDLSREYPKLKKTLVDERDAYIAHALIQTPGKKIVGVVGAGHVKGILAHLEKYRAGKNDEIIPLNELNIVPTAKKNKWIEWGIPIVFAAVFIWLFLQGGIESSLNFFIFWVVGHGILAGAGAILGGAHWTTAIGVFLTAWLAALHPLIAAGWVAAALEAKRDAPNMKDLRRSTS